MSRWEYWDYYERKPAREVKGGIKAQSKRGAFGESWWAKRWITVLESFNIGARLNRGRSYARKGQVMNVEVGEGTVKAKVQGSSSRPYRITIKIKALTERDWKKLAQALSTEALFAAKLLAGEMPQEIEQVFTHVGLSLFPAKLRDLETDCSCPDWSNPCKHIAAVYYLLGEEFDRDPFLLFRLRGMSREELIELLDAAGVGDIHETHAHQAHPAASKLPREPLAADANAFWRGGDLPADLFGEVNTPPVNAALPKRLGGFPFWRGAERFLEALEPAYVQASARGLDVLLGSCQGDRTG
jgi:uncharacterized Zn finger protein